MQLPLPLPDSFAGSLEPSDRSRRVFCNRNLRMDQIQYVGFDMDYTLAIYHQAAMDQLSIEWTVRKLVEARGYDENLLSMPFRTDFPVRGLLVDKKLGNVLKMDRYRYVKKAFHGMRALSRDERREAYHTHRVRPGTARYHWVDTLYALSEVSVFAAAVEALDATGRPVDYAALFTDIRECIDLAHRDGSILGSILADLPKYVLRDPDLGSTLHKLRSSGKKLFLLTNSRAAYTDQMMTYLLGDSLREYPHWRNYFDYVVTAAGKPGFFTKRSPFEVVMDDGTTQPATSFERGKVYAGGNIVDFAAELGVQGDQVLYVGDHIYGDVLRAKKDTAWRTAMIIQEMGVEMRVLAEHAETLDRIDQIEQQRENLSLSLRERQSALKRIEREMSVARDRDAQVSLLPADGGENEDGRSLSPIALTDLRELHRRGIDRVRTKLISLGEELDELEARVDQAFHPFWGALFKSGAEVSIFGDQVEEYACLYTDRVSNFLHYSPMHYFRSPRDRMPHEL